MRLIYTLGLLSFCILLMLQFTFCKNEQDAKALALQQAHISLKKGYEAYLDSESINKIILDIQNEGLNQNHLTSLDSLSNRLVKKIDGDIGEMVKWKSNYRNTELFDSTIEYLEVIMRYEKQIPEFFRFLSNSTEEKNVEAKNNMRSLALLVKEQGDNWGRSKILFYNKFGIKQKEIDSIERMVRSVD